MADDAVKDEKVVDEKDNGAEAVEEEKGSDEVIPVRKNVYYATRRIASKKERVEEKGEETEEETEEELTPSAQNLIRKELSPVVESMKKQSDDMELREYLAENPEHKKFEKQIRKRMDAWKDVPVSEIAKTITFGTDQKARAEKKEEVEQKVRSKSLGGTSDRGQEAKLPSTQAEFQTIYDRIKKERVSIKLGEE